jgi:pimeloyl-ACP methyl ester carboxylesterase
MTTEFADPLERDRLSGTGVAAGRGAGASRLLRGRLERVPASRPGPHRLTPADPPPAPGGALIDAYQVVGPAGAPPIVFVHATRQSRAMWRPQQVGLADTFRVVTLDLPGHGAVAARAFRLPRAVDQVARIIDMAADGRALVVGISLGGYVAMELAAQHPERVAGLMICGATTEPWAIMRRPELVAARLVLALEKERRAHWSRFLPQPIAVTVADGSGRGIRLDGGTQALLEIMGRRFRPRLACYPGPTLFVNGARDRLMRRHEGDFLRTARQGSLLVLPNVGHMTNLEDPERFNRIVRRFANSVAR